MFCDLNSQFWIRTDTNTASGHGFNDWQRCDNFGCSTPAALASLLGDCKHIGAVSLDTIVKAGFYNILNTTDNPFGYGTNAIMVVYTTTDENNFMVLQMAYRNGENPKMRWRWANTWQSWVNVAVDIPSFYKNYSDLSSLASALGATNIRGSMEISNMHEQWVSAMEQSFQNAGNATFFSGYNAYSEECGWFGFKMYNDWATVIVFRGYDGMYTAKGQRNSDGTWTFYKFLGGF